MVNNRLAIVDVFGGEQPLASTSGRYWVMQNGEIYNHLELRSELEGLGHRFASHCDTEVLVNAYEEWGLGCLSRLNGDFAFAVWDRETQELVLARDRFGARPLFLAEHDGGIAFASELKALLRHPRARRELDPLGIVESLTTWSVAPDRSAFAGIRELAPAHILIFGPEGLRDERRWWDLDFGQRDDPRPEAELAEELLALLDDSVRLRLRADVPVGAYISGGLDSSAVAALARRHVSRSLETFGVGFADARFDESVFQDRMAAALGTRLTRARVGAGEIARSLPAAVVHAEQPTLRTALAPMLRLSGAVQDAGLKVVLTGEGADELFGGYDLFLENKVRRFWAREPGSRLRPLLLARPYPALAADLARPRSFARDFFARGLSDTDDPLYSHRIRFANTSRCVRLLSPEAVAAAAAAGDVTERLRARLPAGFGRFSPLGKAQYLEIATFLNGYLLHAQGDRMLMGHSIEGRFPYLDYRVAELAARLPDSMRVRGLREKHLLRRAVAPVLPLEVLERRKQAYRAPILRAFVGPDAPPYVAELTAPGRLAEAGLLDPTAVSRLLTKCRERVDVGVSETDEMALVGSISVMLLHEHLVARPVLAAPARPTKVVQGSVAVPPPELAAA